MHYYSMEEIVTHEGYFCSLCNYTSNRKYNLQRHIRMVHEQAEMHGGANVKVSGANVKVGGANVKVDEQDLDDNLICVKCYKKYTRKRYLEEHESKCKGTASSLECEKCKNIYASRSSLSQHRKICKGSTTLVTYDPNTSVASTSTNIQTQNIQTQNNVQNNIQNQHNNNTTITNNVVNVLAFPDEDDQNFDFATDCITKKVMRRIVKSWRPAISFNKFVSTLLDDPRNRCIRKKGPNVAHSEIHTGDNQWELALDSDVYPVLTHHMTVAALSKIQEFKESMNLIISNFHKYVDLLNTDDECEEYIEATQRMKLMIINMSRKWAAEEGITLS